MVGRPNPSIIRSSLKLNYVIPWYRSKTSQCRNIYKETQWRIPLSHVALALISQSQVCIKEGHLSGTLAISKHVLNFIIVHLTFSHIWHIRHMVYVFNDIRTNASYLIHIWRYTYIMEINGFRYWFYVKHNKLRT